MKANKMNKRNIMERMKKKIAERMKINRDLTIIYACAIVCSIVLILKNGVSVCIDSESYTIAWDNFTNGKIDVSRTPVYPCFLGIIRCFFGEQHFYFATICVQHVIFLISVYFFYKVALFVISNRRIAFAISLCYATFSLLTMWNNYILTESLSISGTVIFIYTIVKMYQSHSLLHAIYHILLLLILLFLRPSFIYLLPVLGCVWLLLWFVKKDRITALYGITGLAIAVLSLLSYMKAFEREHGIYACSCVSTTNQLFVARQYEILDPNVISNPELRNYIIKHNINPLTDEKDIWNDVFVIQDNFDLKMLNNAINDSYRNNPIKWIQSFVTRLFKSMDYRIFTTNSGVYNPILGVIEPSLNLLYLLIIIYTVVLYRYITKQHNLPWMSILLYLLTVCNIIVAIIGAQNDWGRLIRASIPSLLLMVGQICTMFKITPITYIKLR